jgi:hypothetical protein
MVILCTDRLHFLSIRLARTLLTTPGLARLNLLARCTPQTGIWASEPQLAARAVSVAIFVAGACTTFLPVPAGAASPVNSATEPQAAENAGHPQLDRVYVEGKSQQQNYWFTFSGFRESGNTSLSNIPSLNFGPQVENPKAENDSDRAAVKRSRTSSTLPVWVRTASGFRGRIEASIARPSCSGRNGTAILNTAR